MNGDIRPPKRNVEKPRLPDNGARLVSPEFQARQPRQPKRPASVKNPQQPSSVDEAVSSLDITDVQSVKKPQRRRWPKIAIGLIVLLVLIIAATIGWYVAAQRPVASGVADKVDFTIESGMTPDQIADLLDEKGLIRSQLAFMVYTRIHGIQGSLQAGHYRIAPTESLAAIASLLQSGSAAQFTITFYPGATIYDPTDTSLEKRTDVYTMLTRAGYSDEEVRAALDKDYDHPLFATKPSGTTLEGYVYGETYNFSTDATVEQVLIHTFDEYYKQIQEKDIVNKAKRHDMSLYDAITLGSIIEREVASQPDDQKQVSQIFHLRLDQGEILGADATFMYAANQRNVPATVDIDSAYNTRRVVGLPPGPIASPSISALEAAVSPAPGDYLYFVSGDDGETHFAHTQSEHDANTAKYCTTLCRIP